MSAESERIAELELAFRKLWGAMLAASLMVEDRHVKAVFAKADAEARRLGLLPREGVMFIEADEQERDGARVQ